MPPNYQRLTGQNNEINSKGAWVALQATNWEYDGLIVYLDIKSLYTIVPVEEAIEIALQELLSSDEVPEISRSAMKSFLRLDLENAHFKGNKMWYTHTDGLAMGVCHGCLPGRFSLAVILANLWMNGVTF